MEPQSSGMTRRLTVDVPEVGSVRYAVNVAESYDEATPAKVIITGFSMGGKGAWYIGSRHQDVVAAVVPIAARVAGGTDWKIPVHVIHSDDDQVVSYSAAKRRADALSSAGAKVKFTTARGLSHYDMGSYRTYFGQAIKSIQSDW